MCRQALRDAVLVVAAAAALDELEVLEDTLPDSRTDQRVVALGTTVVVCRGASDELAADGCSEPLRHHWRLVALFARCRRREDMARQAEVLTQGGMKKRQGSLLCVDGQQVDEELEEMRQRPRKACVERRIPDIRGDKAGVTAVYDHVAVVV